MEEVLTLFQKRKYKVRISIGAKYLVIQPFKYVLETEAVPNLAKGGSLRQSSKECVMETWVE